MPAMVSQSGGDAAAGIVLFLFFFLAMTCLQVYLIYAIIATRSDVKRIRDLLTPRQQVMLPPQQVAWAPPTPVPAVTGRVVSTPPVGPTQFAVMLEDVGICPPQSVSSIVTHHTGQAPHLSALQHLPAIVATHPTGDAARRAADDLNQMGAVARVITIAGS